MNKISFNLQDIFFFLILTLLSIGFYNVIEPLLADLLLTVILVILFYRPYRFFLRKFKNKRHLAAGITLIFIVLIIIIPLFFVGYMLTQEVTDNYRLMKQEWPQLQEKFSEENIQAFANSYPIPESFVEKIDFKNLGNEFNNIMGTVGKYSVELIQQTFTGITMMIIHVFVILFLSYFMLADGKKLLKRVQFLIPLADDDENELLANIKRVTDAVVINTFMLGALEGIYGGILFAVLDIPSPFFWGFVMTILSVIPMVGTNSIMAPMGIIQLLLGNYTEGTIILVLGSGLVLINQNIIRPRLDGNKSGMHTAIVFLGILGGLMWMGIIGFLVGPLITGLFVTIWNQFGKKYKTKLEAYNKGDSETNASTEQINTTE
ncbi:MAG: AI-2E family transporter [Bacteroidota bacterium]|nr:AI-2E family transporter [Bacteroidota bacterium]